MGYFVKRVYDKNTGKEVNFPDKVKDTTRKEFYFRWPESLDEVCVSETDGKDINTVGFHTGKPEEYGLIVKEVEMPNGYYFAIYTYTMLEPHNIEIYNVQFHGFVEVLTKQKVLKDVEEKIEVAAENYANQKANVARQEILDNLRSRRSSTSGMVAGYCAIKVNIMPHTNYNFNWTVGDTALIECIQKHYDYFREQVSRENYRTAYSINLDEE